MQIKFSWKKYLNLLKFDSSIATCYRLHVSWYYLRCVAAYAIIRKPTRIFLRIGKYCGRKWRNISSQFQTFHRLSRGYVSDSYTFVQKDPKMWGGAVCNCRHFEHVFLQFWRYIVSLNQFPPSKNTVQESNLLRAPCYLLHAGDLDVKPRKWQSARHLYFISYLASFVLPPSKRLSKGVKLSSRQMPYSHRWWAFLICNELIKHSAAAPPLLIKRLADLNYCH